MDSKISAHFYNLEAEDKNTQYEAFQSILAAVNEQVDWAYEVWDQLVAGLIDKDNHKRSRYAQFLSALAISDPDKRIINDFPALWQVTKDEKFVTARHSLQAIWKVALAGPEQKDIVIRHLVNRFQSCEEEKNYTLIRADIIEDLKKIYYKTEDNSVEKLALDLIETVDDSKYRKKYMSIWRKA